MHQLCSSLNTMGVEALMAYYPVNDSVEQHPGYAKMQVPYVQLGQIAGSFDGWVILPETYTKGIDAFKRAHIVLWWLSVDNYVFDHLTLAQRVVKKTTDKKDPYRYFDFEKDRRRAEFSDGRILHLVQSYYAKDFLLRAGVDSAKIKYLSDYLDDVFSVAASRERTLSKQDIVLYNPKKMGKITNELLRMDVSYELKPIQNMTPDQVREAMMNAKVYIDFGGHPGMDRMPREAAACGCCVITGKRGAAANEVDVPIPARYKFDDNGDARDVSKEIERICENYYEARADFETYRRDILSEKEKFQSDLKSVVNEWKIGR